MSCSDRKGLYLKIMKIMFQSEIKTSGFDTKVETFPSTDPPLPRTNSFIQSRVWTECIYHLAQSWVCCWLFGYWESKPTGSSFIAALQGDSTAGQGRQLCVPCVKHPGVCTTSDTAQGVFATEGWRLCCQKESLSPSVQVSPLCQPAQSAQSEERDGELSHFLPRLPTTVLGNLYL